MKRTLLLSASLSLCFLIFFAGVCTPWVGGGKVKVDDLRLPKGFKISIYHDEVPSARQLALGDKGTVFVGTRGNDKVYALVDEDKDGKADKKYLVAEDLFNPNGVAFKDGDLYIGEVNRIIKLEGIEDKLADPPEPVIVNDDLPDDTHHGWKYIAFGPDGKLYVPVGAPCNICEPDDPYASILRMDPDGSNLETYARGIRNTVGFAWHPEDQAMWFSDNGRDMLGDDLPPDELNRISGPGLHFGYPYCHAGEILDPEFGEEKNCDDYEAPAQKLGPHVAALGIMFYTGDMFPEEYKNKIFICEHGSWNRSKPIGYRVMTVEMNGTDRVFNYEVFANGWLKGSSAKGRPVALLQLEDGSVLLSDDRGGKIYRITYED